MLETACKFHSAGGSTTQKLQKIEEYIKDHLKRLADMGKEVEGEYYYNQSSILIVHKWHYGPIIWCLLWKKKWFNFTVH